MRTVAALAVAGMIVAGSALVPSAATGPSDEATVVHVLNRAAFGPRPGDVARVQSVGVLAWIEAQLEPDSIPDTGMTERLAGLTTLTWSSTAISERFERPLIEARRERRAQQQPPLVDPDPAMAPRRPNPVQVAANTPLAELSAQKLLRAIYSDRQLEEVLTDFWFNHFNVDARKMGGRFLLTEYERDAIRPHVLGRFRDLLGATAKSPAMLMYLDNHLNATDDLRMGPRPGGRGRAPADARPRPPLARGPNENYARELMELHTLGVDGGFTQTDVTEVARVFTGWTTPGPRMGSRAFEFNPRLHDHGDKTVLGQRIPEGGMAEGEHVLDILARHPSTARFIAGKLARRFVADTPPPALVDRAAARFLETDGDLRAVTRLILTSPEFLSPAAHHAKVKTPFEFVVSAIRATDLAVSDTRPLVRALDELGMPLYRCQPPTGYPDTADRWTSAGALVARMNVALTLANRAPDPDRVQVDMLLGADVSGATRSTISRAGTASQALALTLGSPEFQRR